MPPLHMSPLVLLVFCIVGWKFCCYTAETEWLEHGKVKHCDIC